MLKLNLRLASQQGWSRSGEDTAEAATDAALVLRAKRDPSAFAPLYSRYFDRVYRYCYRRLGDWSLAEDAASAVFVKALAGLPQCRDDAFRSWLFSIAHNVIADVYRGRTRDRSLDAAAIQPDATPGPEEYAVAAEGDRALQALLERLPPDQQRIVELRLAGLNGVEIARVLGKSHAAIRIGQYRAYGRLRDLLATTSGTHVETQTNGKQ